MRDSRRWCVINPASFLWRHPRAVLSAADATGPFPRQPLAGSGGAAAKPTNCRLGGQWGPAHLLTRCGVFRWHTSAGKHVKCHTRQHVELSVCDVSALKKIELVWTGSLPVWWRPGSDVVLLWDMFFLLLWSVKQQTGAFRCCSHNFSQENFLQEQSEKCQ